MKICCSKEMKKYIGKRLAYTLLVLFGVCTITFFVSRIIPGDPATMWVGPKHTQEQLDAARRELGLDRPLMVQYLNYMVNLLQGDLGVSIRTKQPVLDEVGRRYAATFELVTVSILMALAIGIPLGVISAVRKDKPIDHASRTFSISGVAMPVFWLGLILQMTLHGKLGWFPLQGRIGSMISIDHPIAKITGFYLSLKDQKLNLSIFASGNNSRPEIITRSLDTLSRIRQKRLN